MTNDAEKRLDFLEKCGIKLYSYQKELFKMMCQAEPFIPLYRTGNSVCAIVLYELYSMLEMQDN